MPREWAGSVFVEKDRSTFSAKWKEFGTERWRVEKGFRTKADAQDFLARKRREYRQRRRGEYDPFQEHRNRPLIEHVADFQEHILGNRRRRTGERTERHATQSCHRLKTAFRAMKALTFPDLTTARVERFLAKLIDSDGLSVKTRNDYAAVLRQFARWAVADQRLERDPLGNVRFLANVAGPAKKQTFSWQQVRDLAAACVQRQVQRAPASQREDHVEHGRRRALAVLVMFLTGLRNNELAHLQWDWIDFEAGYITVPHAVSKSARTEFVPLHSGLAQLLTHEKSRRSLAAGRPTPSSELIVGELRDGAPVLPHHINDRLRRDLEFLGWPTVDERGRVASLYSMRTSFATELTELGAPDGVVSDLMRHGASDVTRQHYVQRSLRMLRLAVDLIPAEVVIVPGLFLGPILGPNQVVADVDPCSRVEERHAR